MKILFCFTLVCFDILANCQNIIIKKDVLYGKATNFRNSAVDLKLDLLIPSVKKKFPLIIFLHGGGFMENSSKESHLSFCERLAKNEFVVANVEYRRGFNMSFSNLKNEFSKAVYRVQQDELAAIRYLLQHANEFYIDTNLVFIAGESAGAVASLFTAYASQKDWDYAAPEIHKALGDLYTSGDDIESKHKIKAVIALWGGIADTAFISKNDMLETPVLLFHSVDDEEIPFERSLHPRARHQLLLGSMDIAHRFKNNDGCYELHFVKNAGHAFGFSYNYIERTITEFVHHIMKNECSSAEIENNSGNIGLSFMDTDDEAFPDEVG